MEKKKHYRLQIKEQRIVKDCYGSDELPCVSSIWIDYMIGCDKQKMQNMIDKSLCKDNYRIIPY